MEYIGAIEQAKGKIAVKEFLPMQPGDVPHIEAEVKQPVTLSEVFHIAYGQRTTLNELAQLFKSNLTQFGADIAQMELQ